MPGVTRTNGDHRRGPPDATPATMNVNELKAPLAKTALAAACSGVFLLASLWTMNLTAYHWWAAGGPPSPDQAIRDWHEQWGNIFAGATVLAWLVVGVSARMAWTTHQRRVTTGCS